MELRGLTGSVFADNRNDLRLRKAAGYDDFEETKMSWPESPSPFDDPFPLLEAVVRGRHILQRHDLSALENDLLVVERLEAVGNSTRKGEISGLNDLFVRLRDICPGLIRQSTRG